MDENLKTDAPLQTPFSLARTSSGDRMDREGQNFKDPSADLAGDSPVAEQELIRVKRALRTISECVQAIVRAGSEQEFIEHVCNILVDVGGYRMAWIGYPEDESACTLRAAANCGDEDYLKLAVFNWKDDEDGAEPSALAFRSGRICACSITELDRSKHPWCEEALKRGYLSLISLPLLRDHRTLGVLTTYASETGAALDQEEVKLLSELADEVSLGIDTLRIREEHKKTEIALRKSEQRYRDFISHANEGVWRIEMDRPFPVGISEEAANEWLREHAYIAECNLAHARNCGFSSPDDLIGRYLKDVLPSCDEVTRERVRDSVRCNWQSRTGEYRGRCRDGNVRWLRRTEVPIVEDGKVVRIWGVTADITERKRIEEELQREKAFSDAFIDSLPDVFCLLQPNGQFFHWGRNPERFLGYSGDDTRNMENALSIVAEEDRPVAAACIQQAFATGGSELELRLLHKDGRKIPYLLRGTRTVISEQTYLIVIGLDITERKRLEDQLLQAQKMEAVGQLASGLAHDFNNILGVIMGYADLILLDDSLADSPTTRRLAEVKKAAERAVSLTRQLLAFSRKQMVQSSTIDLNTVVNDAATMLKRLLREDIELVTVLPADLDPIHADPTSIHQIIMNLAVNARDAMPGGGSFTIETANVQLDRVPGDPDLPSGDYVLLAVSDTGSGMDVETQKRIFEPFFTTKGRERGTGLGLSTVYGIVKQSKGHIRSYSEIGVGTTFKIYFPRINGASLVNPAEDVDVKLGQGETILLVEDDPALRELNSDLLENLGYKVISTCNGADAFEAAEKHAGRLHLLMTDVIMPGMDGQQVAQKLSTLRPGLKVLFVSGYAGSAIREKITESGAAFLQKPFTRTALASRLRELLSDSPQLTSGGDARP